MGVCKIVKRVGKVCRAHEKEKGMGVGECIGGKRKKGVCMKRGRSHESMRGSIKREKGVRSA